MILHVIEAKYERDYIIHLKFNDGAEGFVDLAKELYGEMFAPLKNKENFKAFRVDPELNTIVWENGADLAPEFLRDRLLVPAQREGQHDQQSRHGSQSPTGGR
jgi:ribosomal protein L31E